jgi:hypothetical protein
MEGGVGLARSVCRASSTGGRRGCGGKPGQARDGSSPEGDTRGTDRPQETGSLGSPLRASLRRRHSSVAGTGAQEQGAHNAVLSWLLDMAVLQQRALPNAVLRLGGELGSAM